MASWWQKSFIYNKSFPFHTKKMTKLFFSFGVKKKSKLFGGCEPHCVRAILFKLLFTSLGERTATKFSNIFLALCRNLLERVLRYSSHAIQNSIFSSLYSLDRNAWNNAHPSKEYKKILDIKEGEKMFFTVNNRQCSQWTNWNDIGIQWQTHRN